MLPSESSGSTRSQPISPSGGDPASERLPITLCIGARNEERQLRECIESCAAWVSEIVVVDMESEDATGSIARDLGARVVTVPNAGFVEPGRQKGIEAAREDWVLILDADERAGPALRDLVAGYVARDDLAGVYLPRQNYLFGRWIRHSGYWPDHQMRLVRPRTVEWPPLVHTKPRVNGPTEKAPASPANAIVHHNYASIGEWVERNNRYTDFEVDRFLAIGRKPSLLRLLLAPPARFLNTYIRHQGFRDGLHGLAIAILMGCYAAIVELKLWERRRATASSGHAPS